MADKTVSVEFRFPGLEKGAQDMERLARAGKEAGGGAAAVRQRFGNGSGNGAGSGFWGDMPNAFDRITDRSWGGGNGTPGTGVPPTDSGLPRYQNPLAGTGFARIAMPLFIAHTIGAVTEGLGKGMEEISQNGDKAASALSTLSLRMLESLPIIGGLVKGVESISDAMTGLSGAKAGNAAFATVQARLLGTQVFSQHARLGMESELAGLERGGELASLSAGAAAGFRSSLSPDVLGFYTPRAEHGITTARTGPLRARAGMAAFEANAAAEEARLEQARLASRLAASNAGGLGEGAAAQEQRAAVGLRRMEEIEAAIRGKTTFRFGGVGPNQIGMSVPEANVAAENARATAAEAARNAGALRTQQLADLRADREAQQELFGARKTAAQRQLEAQQAGLAAGPGNRLDIVNQQIDSARGGALAAGVHSPLQTQALLDLARFASQNPDGLSPEQKAMLLANPTTHDFFERRFRELGAQRPEQQALEQQFGAGKPLAALEDEAKGLREDMVTQNAKFVEEFRKAVSDANKDMREAIVPIIREEARAEVEKYKAEQIQKAAQGR